HAPPAKGYVVLTEAQARRFKKPDGGFRADIPPREITPLLFGSANTEQRPTILYRETPAPPPQPLNLFDGNSSIGGVGDGTDGTGGPTVIAAAPPSQPAEGET